MAPQRMREIELKAMVERSQAAKARDKVRKSERETVLKTRAYLNWEWDEIVPYRPAVS